MRKLFIILRDFWRAEKVARERAKTTRWKDRFKGWTCLLILLTLTGCVGPHPLGGQVQSREVMTRAVPVPLTNTFALQWQQPGHPYQFLTVSESNDLRTWSVVTNLRVPCLYSNLVSQPMTVPMSFTVHSTEPKHFWKIE